MNPGLYIHIPFCRSKCPYCDFYSIASSSLIPKFIYAIKREITHYKNRFNSFDTLYIGGGTPTILSDEHISLLIRHVFEEMRLLDGSEITIEVNPSDISMERAKFLKKIEINRVSLGIQSFDDNMLKFLGRRHTSQDAIRAFEHLRKAGFENISIDLIYAIPGQSLAEWIHILENALYLFPEHISCYELSFEKGTPLWLKLQKGVLSVPDEDSRRSFFMETSELLEAKGYIHYEISNFAREREYISRHNQKYWLHVPYLGLGPSAHSFDGRRRWWNISSVKKYCELIKRKGHSTEAIEELSEEQIRMEMIFLGLRTCFGIRKDLLKDISENILLKLQQEELLQLKEDMVIPTRRGFSVADQLSSHLLSF